jgi:hypothetical protein
MANDTTKARMMPTWSASPGSAGFPSRLMAYSMYRQPPTIATWSDSHASLDVGEAGSVGAPLGSVTQ